MTNHAGGEGKQMQCGWPAGDCANVDLIAANNRLRIALEALLDDDIEFDAYFVKYGFSPSYAAQNARTALAGSKA